MKVKFSYLYLCIICFLFSCENELEEMIRYHKNGIISERIFLDKNKRLQGRATKYYSNGKVQKINNFKNGELNGYCFDFYENGELEVKSKYDSNKLIDTFYQFLSNGKLEAKVIYDKKGNTIKEIFFYPNGKIRNEDNYFVGLDTELACSSKYYDDKGKLLLSDTLSANSSYFVTMNENKETIHFNLKGMCSQKPDSVILNVVENYDYDLFQGEPKSKRKITYLDHKKLFYKPTDSDYSNDKLFIILEEYGLIEGQYVNLHRFYVQLTKGQQIPKDNLHPMYIK